jgi:glutamyl/glutaminyl-tRNA synthetase
MIKKFFLDEMAKEFDLHKVHKAGARFSKEKAEWFNHQYIQMKSDEELLEMLKNSGLDFPMLQMKTIKSNSSDERKSYFPERYL